MVHRPQSYLVLITTLLAIHPERVDAEPTVQGTTVTVPMRDGILLSTDIYRDPHVDKSPVIITRTPYNKQGMKSAAERFVAAGYAFVAQDCRGRFESEGVFVPYNNEGQDGYDAIEWLVRQPWCNGRVGMWGSSYVGATQWQAAVEQPPGLVSILPVATWSSFYRNLYLGGAVRLSLIAGWARNHSVRPAGITPAADWDATLMHLPLSEVDSKMGWSIPWLKGMLTHPRPDGFWKRLELSDQVIHLQLPMQHVVGYYDFFSRETVGSFERMRKQASHPEIRNQQQLILGPWDHGTIGKSKVGEVDFGPHAQWDNYAANVKWFDRYLKQDAAALATPFSPVRYFSMGDNAWHTAQTWPPNGFRQTTFFLHSGGNANTLHGDGTLNRKPPTTQERSDRFIADPANPTPACPVTDARPRHRPTWAPVNQQKTEEREDVLVYTSEPLLKPLVFAGNIKAQLHVSADTPDADWVVKLVDVFPNGFAQNLAVGLLRGRFRDSELTTTPLTPGKIYEITVDLGPVAAQIAPGHRMRVDISGAYFPLFDRNPNTGEGPFGQRTMLSTEYVFHRSGAASRLILPIKTIDTSTPP